MRVAGKQVLVDDAIGLAVDTMSTFDFKRIFEVRIYIFQA